MIPRLHLVTNDAVAERADFVVQARAIAAALERDVAIHLRAHELSARSLFELAAALVPGVPVLFVNDRADVALAAGVRGVHLGARSLPVAVVRRLLPEASIGYSAHSAAESARAEAEGANFVFAGSIYPTASHPGAPAAGVAFLRKCAAACRIPVLAIGGVTAERVAEVREAGAYGVAVISAVWDAPDPVQAALNLARMLNP